MFLGRRFEICCFAILLRPGKRVRRLAAQKGFRTGVTQFPKVDALNGQRLLQFTPLRIQGLEISAFQLRLHSHLAVSAMELQVNRRLRIWPEHHRQGLGA